MIVSRYSSFLLCLLFVGAPLVRARDSAAPEPPPLTLSAALEEALAHSPALVVADAEIDAARGEVLTAEFKPNPELTFSPGVRRLSEGDASHREFLGSLELSRTFLFPGKRELLVSIAQKNVALRRLAVDGLRFQLSAAVRKAFYSVLAAQSIIGLRQQQLESAEAFHQATTKRAESGYASDFEAVKSAGDVINARRLLAAAEGELAAARVELATLLGRDGAEAIPVAGDLRDTQSIPAAAQLQALAQASNPSLRLQAMQAEIAGLNVRRARLARKPDLTLGPSLEYSPSEQIFSLSASVPLPSRNFGRGEVLTATAEQRRVRAETERLRREIAGAVAKAAAEYASARQQLALYTPAYLEQLKAVVARAEQGYAQNATSLLIYLDAKRTYFDTLAGYYDAIASVAASRAALESAVGVPLPSTPSTSNR